MPLYSLAGLAVGVAVVSIGLYHAAVVGPRLRALGRILSGTGDAADGDSIARLRIALAAQSQKCDERLDTLEGLARTQLFKVGFLRYNSFEDVGSDLSFTLALLNDQGDGVLVTSIFSREETRTFGKSVRRFVASQGASKEEQTAISMARTGVGAGVS